MPILEHQSALHGYTLYDEMIRIPALFVGVGVAGGGRSLESLTDTTDVRCWLRSAARGAPGCRLTPFLAAGTEPEQLEATVVMSAAASVKGGIYAIRSPRAKFVSAPKRGSRWGIGSGRGRSWRSESLFDLIRDPAERNDLLAPGAPDGREAARALGLDRLRLDLEIWLALQNGLLEETPGDEAVDPAVERRLRGLGYVQ